MVYVCIISLIVCACIYVGMRAVSRVGDMLDVTARELLDAVAQMLQLERQDSSRLIRQNTV